MSKQLIHITTSLSRMIPLKSSCENLLKAQDGQASSSRESNVSCGSAKSRTKTILKNKTKTAKAVAGLKKSHCVGLPLLKQRLGK